NRQPPLGQGASPAAGALWHRGAPRNSKRKRIKQPVSPCYQAEASPARPSPGARSARRTDEPCHCAADRPLTLETRMMWFISRSRRQKTGRNIARHSRFVPRLENLEDRTVPSTLTVLNNLDNGAGSLRDAISHAMDGDRIVFAPSLDGQTIALTSGELTINKSLDIEGPGAEKLAISGQDASRVFDVSSGVTVIAGLTITHGNASEGAGIRDLGGDLSLNSVHLSDNHAIGSPGSGGQGGAIANLFGATLHVNSDTIIGNDARGGVGGGAGVGGGIYNFGSTLFVCHSLLVDNR